MVLLKPRVYLVNDSDVVGRGGSSVHCVSLVHALLYGGGCVPFPPSLCCRFHSSTLSNLPNLLRPKDTTLACTQAH